MLAPPTLTANFMHQMAACTHTCTRLNRGGCQWVGPPPPLCTHPCPSVPASDTTRPSSVAPLLAGRRLTASTTCGTCRRQHTRIRRSYDLHNTRIHSRHRLFCNTRNTSQASLRHPVGTI